MSIRSPAIQLCADFALFSDDTEFGANFALAGFDFSQLGGSNRLFVNATGVEKGLQFPLEGVEITLPVPVPIVNLRIGVFAGPVDIAAVDSAGAVVRQRTIPGLNRYINVRIAASDITSLALTNGGNEGSIVSICVALCLC